VHSFNFNKKILHYAVTSNQILILLLFSFVSVAVDFGSNRWFFADKYSIFYTTYLAKRQGYIRNSLPRLAK